MMEKLVSLDQQVHLGRLEYQGLQANGDQLDKLVKKGDKEKKDPRESLELKGPLAKLGPLDLRDPLERLAQTVCEESLAQLVNKDFLVLPDKTVPLDL